MNQESLKKKLDEYFSVIEYTAEQALNALSLLIFSFDSEKNDLFILAKLLKPSEIAKLVYYYNGASLRIPTIEEYKRSKILASCYYLREIKGWDWITIKEYLSLTDEETPDEGLTKSIGKNIAEIKRELRPDFLEVLIDKYGLDKILKGYIDDKES